MQIMSEEKPTPIPQNDINARSFKNKPPTPQGYQKDKIMKT
jgi:hypothetical protein